MSFITDLLGDVLGPIGAILGIGSGAKTLFGGGQQGGSSSANTYVPTGLGGADQAFQDALAQIQGSPGSQNQLLNPLFQQALQQMLGINTSGLTGAANQAGELSGALVPQANNIMQMLQQQAGVSGGAQQNLLGAGNQLYQTSLDPQNALRNQLMQQVQDASRAGTSMRGIGTGAESAGIENDAMRNFMLQWEQSQLGRQATGVQGLAGASDAAGRQGQQVGQNLTGSLAAGSLAPGFALASGATPYSAAQTAAQQPYNAATQYQAGIGGQNQPYGSILSSIIPYLNQGQGATGQLFNQQQAGLGNIASGLNFLGSPSGANGMNSAWNTLSGLFNHPLQDVPSGSQGDVWAQGGFGT